MQDQVGQPLWWCRFRHLHPERGWDHTHTGKYLSLEVVLVSQHTAFRGCPRRTPAFHLCLLGVGRQTRKSDNPLTRFHTVMPYSGWVINHLCVLLGWTFTPQIPWRRHPR